MSPSQGTHELPQPNTIKPNCQWGEAIDKLEKRQKNK